MTHDPRRHHRRSIRLKGYDYAQAGAYFVTITAHERVCLFGAIVDGEMRLNEYGEGVVRWWADIPQHFETVDIDAFVVMPNHVHGIVIIADPNVGAGSPRPGWYAAMGAGTDTGSDPGPAAGQGAGTEVHQGAGTAPVRPGNVAAGFEIVRTPVGAGSPRPDPRAAIGAGTAVGQGVGTQVQQGAGTAPLRRPALGNVIAYFKYQSAKHINAPRQMPGAPVWQRNYYEHVIRTDASLNRIRQYIVENPARWASDRENPGASAPEPVDVWRI